MSVPPADAGRNQHQIGQSADAGDGKDVAPRQPLPEHEGVLCPDGNDQAGAEQEAFDHGGEQQRLVHG